jgi:hypothetical protein
MHRAVAAAAAASRLLAASAALAAPSASCSASVRLLRTCAALRMPDFPVVVPHMSESISEGIVSELPMPVGAAVAVDDIVAVLETDKVRRRRRTRGREAGHRRAVSASTGSSPPF